MYIKKSLAVVSVLVVLALGYVAGTFIGFPNVDNSMLKGDISKANSFNQADSPEVQAALEQLTNDKELQKQTAAAAALLDARINQMQELANGDDDEWIPDSIECPILRETFDLSSVGKRIQNTREAYDQYLDALAAALKGEKTEGFEQKANNALLAYTVAERNIEALAPEVSSALLQAAEQTGNEKLAEKAAQWIQYSSESAFLSGSESDMAYWQSQADIIANSPVLGAAIQNSVTLCCQNLSAFVNHMTPRLGKATLPTLGVNVEDIDDLLARPNLLNKHTELYKTIELYKHIELNKVNPLHKQHLLNDLVGLSFSPIMSLIITSNVVKLQQKPSPC